MLKRRISVAAALQAGTRVGTWAVLACALGACGQRGPLILPAAMAASSNAGARAWLDSTAPAPPPAPSPTALPPPKP